MSLYELDPVCCDELVQTAFFPSTSVPLNCTVWGCPAAGSDWVSPNFYDSPSWPPKVDAQFAVVSNWAVFSDPNRRCAAYASVDPRYNCK
jgi:hypothetical protein